MPPAATPEPDPKPAPTIHELEILQSQDVRTHLNVSPGLMRLMRERAARDGMTASRSMRQAFYKFLGIRNGKEETTPRE